MKRMIQALSAVFFFLALAAPVSAQDKTDPDEITVGVARITLSMGYASVRVNGEEWEHSYFEEDGVLMVLEDMDRTTEYTLHLVPMEEEFRVEDVTIKPKDWKLARLDRQTRQWQFSKKIKFRPWKPGEREAWEKAQEAAEAEPVEAVEPPPEELKKPEPKPSKVDDTPAAIEEAPDAPEEEAPDAPEAPEAPAEKPAEKPAD